MSTDAENLTVTQKVAGFASGAAFEDLPEPVVAVAKNGILDWLGVTIAGSKEEGVRMISQYSQGTESKQEATAICQGYLTTAELAALVNGTMGHALDFDDTFPILVLYNMHPSAAIVPAVLAAAEKTKTTGRKLITGYVVGMEVMYRIGDALAGAIAGSGWHPTPVIGSLGCAAACSNIYELSPVQTQNALGIAASLSGGFLKNFGSMTKPMHAGNAARNGVVAVELALLGFNANNAVFDGNYSFIQMFGNNKLAGLMDKESDLGKNWQLLTTGIGFKPYPSCRSTHTSIDATIYLRNKYGITADQVSGIICRISPIHTQICRFHRPETGYQGKFSIPFNVATALRKGTIILEDFTDDKVGDAETQELASKVKFEYPQESGKGAMELTSEITIRLNDGLAYSRKVELPKGEPENPMTDRELDEKFISCAGRILSKRNVNKVLNLTRSFDELEDMSPLFKVLRKS